MLTQEERNDLRRRVLMGHEMTIEEARQVFESLRQQVVVDMTTAPSDKPKRGKKSAKAMSDEDLDKSLGSLGL